MEDYKSLDSEGFMALMCGQSQLAANKCREAFLASPSKWADGRFDILHRWTSVLARGVLPKLAGTLRDAFQHDEGLVRAFCDPQ